MEVSGPFTVGLARTKTIDAQVAANQEVHQIMDNYATHKSESVRAWLAARPR